MSSEAQRARPLGLQARIIVSLPSSQPNLSPRNSYVSTSDLITCRCYRRALDHHGESGSGWLSPKGGHPAALSTTPRHPSRPHSSTIALLYRNKHSEFLS